MSTVPESIKDDQSEKPLIDLHEFLQQIGVLKKESEPVCKTITDELDFEPVSKVDGELNGYILAEDFGWDEPMEILRGDCPQQAEPIRFQDYNFKELTLSAPIWNL